MAAYPAEVFQAAATMAALVASSPLILKLHSKSRKREELLFFKSYALAWVTIVTQTLLTIMTVDKLLFEPDGNRLRFYRSLRKPVL